MQINHRVEVLKFAKVNGLEIKGDRQKIVTIFNPKTNFVDCFEGWFDAHSFLKNACIAKRDNLIEYPWNKVK